VDLAVVVVSWNVRGLLGRCLRSVQVALADSGLSWQAVVVDSASSDGSAEMVRRDFPDVALLELPENRGFAAACNAALRASFPPLPTPRSPLPSPLLWRGEGGSGERRGGPQALLLLNADTEIIGPAITEMLACLGAHPEVGVVGPRLRYPDGTVQSSRRRFPTPATLFWESTVLEQCWPGNPWARRYHLQDRPDDVEQEVDWLVGACLLVRAGAVAQAGLLDEGYFLYFEELEWLQRIHRAGWRAVYLPTAQVVHHEGRSSEQVPLQRHLQFQRSKVRYARQEFGPAWAAALRYFLLGTYAWKLLVEGAKWLVGHKRELRRERMGVYRQVLRDGLGTRCVKA
jgi:N-acetylglucosaminyl-diphospho-decaprenol L-rhamnosyltransferase